MTSGDLHIAGLQAGDDVDEIAKVTTEPIDFPDDQGVAGAPIR